MATVNPTVISAYNATNQDLFTVSLVNDTNDTAGVPQYNSVGASFPIVFDTVVTSVGTDASLDTATGELTLAADIVWSVLVQADQNGPGPIGTYQFVSEDDNTVEGLPQPLGHPLVLTVLPAIETVYQVIAFAPEGTVWNNPSQLANVSIVVTAVSGFEA
jgi:hypothetical protein